MDAAVSGGHGRFIAELSPEWAAWGPNGGYVAAILLRAAVSHGSFPRVATLSCHFLSVGRFAAAQVEVTTLRRSKQAESVRAVMSQDGKPVAEGMVWLVADGLDGLGHDVAQMPDVPGPGELPSFTDLAPDGGLPLLPMWNNIDGKPITWSQDWKNRSPGQPYANGWYRFPAHTTDDAGRQLVLLDVMAWSAAWNAHPPQSGYIAPNLDLSVQFHRPATDEQWLFAEGFADVAQDGLIGFRTRVWSQQGALLASGAGQLLCRPT